MVSRIKLHYVRLLVYPEFSASPKSSEYFPGCVYEERKSCVFSLSLFLLLARGQENSHENSISGEGGNGSGHGGGDGMIRRRQKLQAEKLLGRPLAAPAVAAVAATRETLAPMSYSSLRVYV